MREALRSARLAVAAIVLGVVLGAASAAYAYNENVPYPYAPTHSSGDCFTCHTNGCMSCHNSHGVSDYRGPHGGYAATTNKCAACHQVHQAEGSLKLLAGDTIDDSCQACHDGTGGNGVYGAIAARGGTPAGQHRIDTVTAIPGGDAATGGSATRVFKGEGGQLTCTDCHSPHESQVVGAFYSDRVRSVRNFGMIRNEVPISTKLLKQRPTGAVYAVTDYGSDWCLTCHSGRDSGGAVHNHPVETSATVATPYVYRSLPVLVSDGPTTSTVLGQLGGRPNWRGSGNRGYLMPYPRSAQQDGHYPICMQCHEDTRDVGDLDADGVAMALTSVVTTLDGRVDTDNPRFQTFPHETVNDKFVVETADDLCLNCHTVGGLP